MTVHKIDYPAYFFALVSALAAANPVAAQSVGQIVRDVERHTDLETPKDISSPDLLPSETREQSVHEVAGASFRVERFQVESTLIAPQALQDEVRAFVGRDCTLTDLREAAARIAALYRRRHLLAYVSVPPQTMQGGVVKLRVIEARLGNVTIEAGSDVKLDKEFSASFITSRNKKDHPVRIDNIARGVSALRSIAGVDAHGILRAGDAPGYTDVRLRLTEARSPTFTAVLDNHTTSELGGARALAIVSLNDFDGKGKRLAFTGQLTRHSRFGEVATSVPAMAGGLWIDGAFSLVNYGLAIPNTSADSSGGGIAASIGLRWYAMSESSAPITFTSGFEFRRISNDLAAVNIASNRLFVLSFGANRIVRSKQGGGSTVIDVRLRAGQLDLGRNPGNLAFDRATARTQGRYAKFSGLAAHSRPIGDDWAIRLAVSGQFSSKNLNGIERLAFGGPGSIAGFSTAQLDGDEGVLLSAELSRSLSSNLRMSAGWAGGCVSQHKHPWKGWEAGPQDRNRYAFQGLAASAKFAMGKNLWLSAEVGVPLSRDPSALANRGRPVRAWLQVINVVA